MGFYIPIIRIPYLSKVGWVYPQYNERIDPSTSLVKKKIGALTVLSFSIASAFFKSWFGGSSDKKVPKRHHHKEMMKQRWKVQSDRFGKMVSKRSRNDITTKTMEETNRWKCESFQSPTLLLFKINKRWQCKALFIRWIPYTIWTSWFCCGKLPPCLWSITLNNPGMNMFAYIWLILL